MLNPKARWGGRGKRSGQVVSRRDTGNEYSETKGICHEGGKMK